MRRASRTSPPDFWLFVAILILVAGGVLIVFDASFARAGDKGLGDAWYYVKRQMVYAALGLAGMFLAMRIHPSILKRATMFVLVVALGLLVAVMIPGVGRRIGGAARWIPIGPFHLQPSEVAKVAVVMYLASQLATKGARLKKFGALVPHILLVGLVAALVLAEPDMGTAAAIIFTAAVMFYIAGARKRHLLALGGAGALAGAVMIAIEPYRLERFYTWLNPWRDYRGSGYQIIHSLIALGTGGFWGQGIGKGREKFYIPAPQTDMIGTTVAEEAGFIGMVVLLGLFVLFIYRGLCIGHRARCPYMGLLATGITSMIGIQALMNMAVFTASMPMTGVPLPFISYGGSYLIAMLFGAGMVLSVSRHTDEVVVEPRSEEHEGRHYGRRNRRTYLSCTEYRPAAKRRGRRASVRR